MMNEMLRITILLVAVCAGCSNEQNSPKPSSQNTSQPTSPSKQAPSPSNLSPQAEDALNQEQADALADDSRSEYVSFPQAGVKLLRPLGFNNSENFRGFQDESSKSVIMVSRMPGPFSVRDSFTAEKLAEQGMTLHSKQLVQIDGETGVLLNVTQGASGEATKWVLQFGNAGDTILISAAFPTSPDTTLSKRLRSVLLGTRLETLVSKAPENGVGFTITPSEKLKPVETVSGFGKIRMYTKYGIVPSKNPDDAMFLAAPSLYQVPIGDGKKFAEQRILQTASVKNFSITSNVPITIDALDGFETIASAENDKSGIPMLVYQVILYDEGAYFLMQGLAWKSESYEYLSEFQKMARSLKRQPK